MNRLLSLYNIASRYRYFIVITICILVVGFLDENSMYHKIQLQFEIDDLKSEIDQYNKQYHDDQRQLRSLARNPRNIERIAREKYFMKAENEDIFVIRDNNEEETND